MGPSSFATADLVGCGSAALSTIELAKQELAIIDRLAARQQGR